MGNVVDLVLDGILCEACGAFVDGNASGYPRKCIDCRSGNEIVMPEKKSYLLPYEILQEYIKQAFPKK